MHKNFLLLAFFTIVNFSLLVAAKKSPFTSCITKTRSGSYTVIFDYYHEKPTVYCKQLGEYNFIKYAREFLEEYKMKAQQYKPADVLEIISYLKWQTDSMMAGKTEPSAELILLPLLTEQQRLHTSKSSTKPITPFCDFLEKTKTSETE